MSKTFWMLSAGLTALATTPAYAQDPAQTAENDDAIVRAAGHRQSQARVVDDRFEVVDERNAHPVGDVRQHDDHEGEADCDADAVLFHELSPVC